MKLLYITNGISGAGGLERVLSIKASMLADQFGYDVHIFGLNEQNVKPFYEFSSKIHFHSISVDVGKMASAIGYISGLRRLVKAIKPDVISVCDDGFKGFFLPIILAKPCPMIYERHVSRLIAGNPKKGIGRAKLLLQSVLMDKLAGSFDRFVVLSKGNLSEWKSGNLKVIHNPLSFYPDTVSDLENKLVIAVGRQSYQKGYDRLLQAWKLIAQKHPDWKLEIYGKFDPSLQLVQLAEKLGISTVTAFYPPAQNISEIYQKASALAMSSRFEGFGMVLTEAMACGVPCVSFDCPHGPSDIITHNRDGILVKNNDIEELANSALRLIEDPDLRKKMGMEARKNVLRFSTDEIVREWDNLFRSFVK